LKATGVTFRDDTGALRFFAWSFVISSASSLAWDGDFLGRPLDGIADGMQNHPQMSPLPFASSFCFLVTGSLVEAALLMALIVPDMLSVIGLNVVYGYHVVQLAVGIRPTVV
jgi:hypothetical protein